MCDKIWVVWSVGWVVRKKEAGFLLGLELEIVKGIIDGTARGRNEG